MYVIFQKNICQPLRQLDKAYHGSPHSIWSRRWNTLETSGEDAIHDSEMIIYLFTGSIRRSNHRWSWQGAVQYLCWWLTTLETSVKRSVSLLITLGLPFFHYSHYPQVGGSVMTFSNRASCSTTTPRIQTTQYPRALRSQFTESTLTRWSIVVHLK